MDLSELDKAYNIAAVVENFLALLNEFAERSKLAYSRYNWCCNLRYGKETGNRYDFFSCGIPYAPTYVFVHGGYWISGSKEEHAFIAAGPIAHNMNVVPAADHFGILNDLADPEVRRWYIQSHLKCMTGSSSLSLCVSIIFDGYSMH